MLLQSANESQLDLSVGSAFKSFSPIGSPRLTAAKVGMGKLINSARSHKRGPRLWLRVAALLFGAYILFSAWKWSTAVTKLRVWNPTFGYLEDMKLTFNQNQLRRPTVSVILPNYNGAFHDYLTLAVESILNQDFADFELIVVDDGSKDESLQLLKQFNDPRLFVLEKGHTSLPDTLNSGHNLARGKYLTWVSADNVHYPNFLSTFVNTLDDYVEVGLAVSDYRRIDDEGKELGPAFMPWQLEYPDALGINPGVMSFMYRRDCYDKTGPYRMDLEGVEDVELWVRMLATCKSMHIRTQLADYRIHNHRMSATMTDVIKEREDAFKIDTHARYGPEKFLDSLGGDISVNKTESQSMLFYYWGLRYLYLYQLKKQPGLRDIGVDLMRMCAGIKSSIQTDCANRVEEPEKGGYNIPQYNFGKYEVLRAMALAKATYTVDPPIIPSNRRKPRILAVVPSDPLGAYVRKGRGHTLTDYYNPLGFFDKVYALTPRETESYEMAGMTIIPTTPEQLPQRLRDLNVDVVRAYGGYWASDYAVYFRHPQIPVVVSVHDTNERLLHKSLLGADYVWSVSGAVSNALLEKGLEPQRLFSFTNRVDVTQFGTPVPEEELVQLRQQYPTKKYRIVHVGRKEPQKNGDTLIRALAELGEDYALVMLGPGPEDWLWKVADEVGVRDRVYMLQGTNNLDLPKYYQMADVFCTPSRWEGFGIVFIEGLASGAVTVTSNVAPVNEIVHHERNGLLVDDYENPVAMAEQLRRAATDEPLRAKLKVNARQSALFFSKERVDAMEAQLYRMVLRGALPPQTMDLPEPLNCTEYAKGKNINMSYEIMEVTPPAPQTSAYPCMDADYFRLTVTKGGDNGPLGWAKAEDHDNHPWYSSALRLKVPRTYMFSDNFRVQQPANDSMAIREMRAAAHRAEYCIRNALGELFPAQTDLVYAAASNDGSGEVFVSFTVRRPHTDTEYRVRARRKVVGKYGTNGAPPRYRVDYEAVKVEAAKENPQVNFVISNKNMGADTDVHTKAFFDMLYHTVVMQDCSADKHVGLVIADYGSVNQAHIKEVCKRISEKYLPCQVVELPGEYSRAGGLQAGAAVLPPDSIAFTLDTFLLMAPDLAARIRDTVKKGKTVYAPLVWRNERGAPIIVTPTEGGRYEEYGYGIMGYYVGDLLNTDKFNTTTKTVEKVGGYDTVRFANKRGGEDEDLGGRMVWVSKLDMVRSAEDNGVLHMWHPPIDNPLWSDPAKAGAWVNAPSYSGPLYPELRFDNVKDAVNEMYAQCSNRDTIADIVYGR